MDWVRYRIAFYGSTRSYHGVFAVHGEQELGMKLHAMSKQGRWDEMAAEIPDHVVRTFAAVGTHDEIQAEIEKRFGGLVDSIALDFTSDSPMGARQELVQDVQRVESAFTVFPEGW